MLTNFCSNADLGSNHNLGPQNTFKKFKNKPLKYNIKLEKKGLSQEATTLITSKTQ